VAWNIGNTSVRNPWRIRDGLQVFADEFNGNLRGTALEAAFWTRLAERGVIQSQVVDPQKMAWHGRKWRSCFCKLGLASGDRYYRRGGSQATLQQLVSADLGLTGRPYEITLAGRRLIGADTEAAVADVFLRQLLRLEVASPTEKQDASTQVKPLVLLLQVLQALQDQGKPGLTTEEIATFVQTANNHQNLRTRLQALLDHRVRRAALQGKKEKQAFDRQSLEAQKALAGLTIKSQSLRDYADTTSRYCRATGLVALRGSRLVLRERKQSLVKEILKTQPEFLSITDPLGYLVDFYSGSAIPTDNEPTALRETQEIQKQLRGYGIQPRYSIAELAELDIRDLTTIRHSLEQEFAAVREERFARRHAEDTRADTV